MNIGIVGLGRVGSNLAYALCETPFSLVGICSRNMEKANTIMRNLGSILLTDIYQTVCESDVVFITVSDDAIERVANAIALTFNDSELVGKTFLHMSGAKSSELLLPLSELGAAIGSMHPIQTFSTSEEIPGIFENICFGVEGDEKAIELANEIALNLGSMSVPIKTEGKPFYHMAACFASNYLCVLMDVAETLLRKAGISDMCGSEIMAPLIYQTLDNVFDYGPLMALTGPIARGDTSTVKQHLSALANGDRECETILSMYKMLGVFATNMADDRGAYNSDKFVDMCKLFFEDGEFDD